MKQTTSMRSRIRVLQSTSAPDGTTRYVDQVVSSAPTQVEFAYFSWRTVLFERFDVFHVHWPEILFRAEKSRTRMLKAGAFVYMLLRLRARKIPIVWTLHNLRPHESGDRLERLLLSLFQRNVTLFVRINSVTESDPEKSRTVLHGHYRSRFEPYDRPAQIEGRLLYFGLIRPYKGVEHLISTFEAAKIAGTTLRIVGKPTSELKELILETCGANRLVSARLEFVPDQVLVEEVCSAEVVVLPYKEMHNSGALLVALSLNRPVLAPWSPSNQALANEVGPGWLYMFKGDLTSETLSDTLSEVRSTPATDQPQLVGRDWTDVGLGYHQAYVDALNLV